MTTHTANAFKALHTQAKPLMLTNCWDAASVVLLQIDGAQAVATSSSALAWSLGYADGGQLPRAELLAAVARIMRVATVPVSFDVEDGYSSDAAQVADLVLELAKCGIAGINLEDGAGSPELLASKIAAIRHALAGTPLFINARCDVFLKGLAKGDAAIAMCAQRLASYSAAGADGAFVPGMATVEDVAKLMPALTQLGMPLNLMAVPHLVPVAELFAAGARRFSAGGSLFQTTYAYSRLKAQGFMNAGDVSGLFEHSLPYAFMNAAVQGK
jgi:2-methylisocitrate lyase-like PEP mutase family enzyme